MYKFFRASAFFFVWSVLVAGFVLPVQATENTGETDSASSDVNVLPNYPDHTRDVHSSPSPSDGSPSSTSSENSDEVEAIVVDMTEEEESSPSEDNTETIQVIGERPLSAASDQTIRNKDFMTFPRRSASDLLRFIPGLHITQHTGGAKAHQIFLRGFDAEHGQDVAAYLDGIPLNETSHVHGMGYLDLHFILPEGIKKIWVITGPYDARFGNFATAGVIDFQPYVERGHTYSVAAGGGSNYFAEGIGQVYFDWLQMDTYAIAEFDRTDGYTDPGQFSAGRGMLHHRFRLGDFGELRLLYAGYAARSEAADILPKAWIDKKIVSRFDSLDDSNRVDADRHLLGLTLDWHRKNFNGRVQGYYNFKRTDIFSNYTFYYFNTERGDQLEQSDRRHYAGLNAYVRWVAETKEMDFSTQVGVNLRSDWVNQTQANTEDRVRYNVMNHYEFNETAIGVYLDERMKLASWVRVILGLRYDAIVYKGDGTQDRYGEFDIVTNVLPFYDDDPATLDTHAWALSPKASVVFQPLDPWNIFLNFGRGFVSSYARQLAWEEDTTMPVVTAAEVGTRLTLWNRRLNLAGTAWWAEKESETVFDSEFGTTIPKGRSRRYGGEFEGRISPLEWLYIGTDVYYTKAHFVDTGKRITNMAEWLMTNTVAIQHPKGFKTTVRGRFLGPRTHDMGFHSDAYYLVDLQMGYEIDPIEITLSIENLFDTVWYDSVYAYPSRPEAGGETLEGLHVTPGLPTTARLRVEAHF